MPSLADASGFEIFAKGLAAKTYLDTDKWTTSVSASGGFGFALIPALRIEARYTNISSLQNKLALESTEVTVTLNDIKTETVIYSVGLDVDFLSEKSAFQPFIFVGVGYIETTRSYYYRVSEAEKASYLKEPLKHGVSGNFGLGFRLRLARTLAFEAELFGYGIDIHKPQPLINLNGTVGVRLFL